MISLYSGTPGSGKSLHIADRINSRIKKSLPTVGNFEINLDRYSDKVKRKCKYRYIPNNELSVEKLLQYRDEIFGDKRIREDSILLIIDECQLIFNARQWNQKGREQWLSFFSQHRKYGYEIVLIAQFDGMIDRQIRSLIEYNVIHRKASNFGTVGKVLSLLSFGRLFCAVTIWYPLNEKISSQFFRGSMKLYQIYDTYKAFEDVNKQQLMIQQKEKTPIK